VGEGFFPVSIGLQQYCFKRFEKRVFKHLNRLPSKVANVPSLSVLKRHLDNAFNIML